VSILRKVRENAAEDICDEKLKRRIHRTVIDLYEESQ